MLPPLGELSAEWLTEGDFDSGLRANPLRHATRATSPQSRCALGEDLQSR